MSEAPTTDAVRVNRQFLLFDTDTATERVRKELASHPDCDYVVVRTASPETGKVWFYVFQRDAFLPRLPTPPVHGILLGELPGLDLQAPHAAPTRYENEPLDAWQQSYDQGPWPGAFRPVMLTPEQEVLGIWEPAPPAAFSLRAVFRSVTDKLASVSTLLKGPQTSLPEVRHKEVKELLEETRPTLAPSDDAAYPYIEASDLHPVPGTPLQIEVGLKAAPTEGVAGGVELPAAPPEHPFVLRVHLLCGSESHWDEVHYSRAEGTIEPARFAITAPPISPAADGSLPSREECLVSVNFYLNNRWCGEGLRYLDLRADETVPELESMRTPQESEWRKTFILSADALPPDLLVRIERKAGGYHWSCLSPHLEFDAAPEDAFMPMPEGAENFVRNLFEPYATTDLNLLQQAAVEGVGEQIYRSTPEAFKKAYAALFRLQREEGIPFEHIQLVTDEPYVPWELMRVADERLGMDAEAEFLAVRHAVGRWLAPQSARLVQRVDIRHMAVAASDYTAVSAVNPKLPWAKDEADWLVSRYRADPLPLQSGPIMDFLQNGQAEAVHFACHGQMYTSNPFASKLVLEDHPNDLTPPVIARQEVQRGLGRHHPLIFLNACQIGSAAQVLTLVAGFPAAFLNAGASAVISPLWTVNDAHAKAVMETFYRTAFEQEGATLGEILRTIRAQWRERKHLTFLAYVLYGDPRTRVYLTPETR